MGHSSGGEPAGTFDQAAFDALQERLQPLWRTISHLNEAEQSIVVVPSLSLDQELLAKVGPQALYYEERMLFMLLLLRQPRARVVYVSSLPIDERAIDYLLSLMPGVIPAQARKRLILVSADDSDMRPLSAKVLESPDLLGRIRAEIPDTDRAHLVPYITTELERDLALVLGIPVYGCDPRLGHIGTKTGSKEIFRSAHVPHPAGVTGIRDVKGLIAASADLARNASAGPFIVKLDEGVSGIGNAVVDLGGLVDANEDEVTARVKSLRPEGGATADEYLAEFDARGGIIEELITGEGFTSPSVQLRITPLGEVEVLSSHDQLLGGPTGQIYLGCIFPAAPPYVKGITRDAMLVGQEVAKRGVLGRFAIDFVAVRGQHGWDHYAVEINLRKGGTTHPYLTLQFLTDGRYDHRTGVFKTPSGQERTLVASDHAMLESPIKLDELFELAVVHDLHFDNARQRGVVFHMLGALESYGVIGLTAVEETRDKSLATFQRTLDVIGAKL